MRILLLPAMLWLVLSGCAKPLVPDSLLPNQQYPEDEPAKLLVNHDQRVALKRYKGYFLTSAAPNPGIEKFLLAVLQNQTCLPVSNTMLGEEHDWLALNYTFSHIAGYRRAFQLKVVDTQNLSQLFHSLSQGMGDTKRALLNPVVNQFLAWNDHNQCR